MKRILNIFIYAFFFVPLLPGAEIARVTFFPHSPVNIESRASIDMQQSFPGLSLSTKGEQILIAECVLQHTSDLPLAVLPFEGYFTIKKMEISLDANGQKLHFDSKNGKDSLFLDQVAKILNQPQQFEVGEEGVFHLKDHAFLRLLEEIPLLKDLQPEALLSHFFAQHFVLAGQELWVGKQFSKNYDLSAFPKKLEYTVKTIDDYHVYLDFKGDLDKTVFPLTKKIMLEKEEVPVTVKLNGSVQGTGRWNRDHALLAEIEIHHTYTALFSAGPLQWMVHFNMVQNNHSSAK